MGKTKTPVGTEDLHRRLIPANVVIVAICVAALVFQVSMPFFKMNVTVDGKALSEMIDYIDVDVLIEGTDVDIDLGGVKDAVESLGKRRLTLRIRPSDLLMAAGADIYDLAYLIAGALPSVSSLASFLDDIMNSAAAAVADTVIKAVLDVYIDENDLGDVLSRETLDMIYGAVDDVFGRIAEGDMEGAREMFADGLDDVLAALVSDGIIEDYEDEIERVRGIVLDVYDGVIGYGTDSDGNFSYYTLMMNLDLAVDLVERAIDGEDVSGISAYAEYADDDLDTAMAEVMTYVRALLSDDEDERAQAVVDITRELVPGIDGYMSTVRAAIIAASAVIFILPAALWGILALFALVHMFTRNKKVGMWYVKLCCVWPFLIFVAALNAAVLALPSICASLGLGVVGDILQLVGISFGGSGVYTGICYLLLWAVSIFWCFPVKRRIRRAERG